MNVIKCHMYTVKNVFKQQVLQLVAIVLLKPPARACLDYMRNS